MRKLAFGNHRKAVMIAFVLLVAMGTAFFYYIKMKPLGSKINTDLNDDGVTDQLDYDLVKASYGKVCQSCPEDVNSDGTIDGSDLLLIMSKLYSE